MKGKLYGVGVGPGDKELITLKALRILKEADIIAVPQMKSGERTAFNIIEEYVKDKEIMNCYMPMSKNFDELQKNYNKIADIIEDKLNMGRNVAFITLGDPTVYSTYMQINSIILKRGYETELVPAVTSFCAASAKLNMSLCERDEPLIILPASYEGVREGLKLKGTKVLMKANRAVIEVRNILREENLIDKSVMVECCGMKNEKIYRNLNNLDEKSSYFSVIIVKDKN
ncbi:MAG: precorrin-2 C(20)-methyltransferase [Clostridia bacterium]|nr:precorrin-2 C(20)-methyltransferase [Clostridia bacterium]